MVSPRDDEGWGDENDDWGDDGDGWGDGDDGWDDEDNNDNDTVMTEVPAVDEKGFKFVKPEIMNERLIAGLEELQDLYAMEMDSLIAVARYFKWN